MIWKLQFINKLQGFKFSLFFRILRIQNRPLFCNALVPALVHDVLGWDVIEKFRKLLFQFSKLEQHQGINLERKLIHCLDALQSTEAEHLFLIITHVIICRVDFQHFLLQTCQMTFLSKLRKMEKDKLFEGGALKNCGNNMKLHMSLFVDGMADQFFEYFRGKSTYTFDELESGMLELIQMLLEVPQC